MTVHLYNPEKYPRLPPLTLVDPTVAQLRKLRARGYRKVSRREALALEEARRIWMRRGPERPTPDPDMAAYEAQGVEVVASISNLRRVVEQAEAHSDEQVTVDVAALRELHDRVRRALELDTDETPQPMNDGQMARVDPRYLRHLRRCEDYAVAQGITTRTAWEEA